MKHQFTVSEPESRAQFQVVSHDQLTHNATQGVNYWAGSDYPTMLLWAGRIYDFLRVLEGITGFYPARRQSYIVGYKSGWDGAAVSAGLPGNGSDKNLSLRILEGGAKTLAGAGWGRCSIEYDDQAGTVRWEFPHGTAIGLAARREEPRTKPACPFFSGFIAGWTNRALGTNLEFDEPECVGRGDSRCVFESVPFMRPKKEFLE